MYRTPLLDETFPLPLNRPFTVAMAAEAGLGRHVVARLLDEGLVRRLCRGVYVASPVPDSLLLRAQALALVVPEHAAVTDWTACWLWTGLLPPNQHLEVPPVCFFRFPGRGRLRKSLCRSGERTFLPRDLDEVAGVTVTNALRTAWDLGRLERRDGAIVALDGLCRGGGVDREELLGGIGRFRGQRGVVQLRALAPLADGRAESPGESVLRLRWLDQPSLPRPEPQVVITGAEGREAARIDLGVPELKFGLEYDGEEFHGSAEQQHHDVVRRAWLRREHGWVVEAVGREEVYGPRREVYDRLQIGIRHARETIAARR